MSEYRVYYPFMNVPIAVFEDREDIRDILIYPEPQPIIWKSENKQTSMSMDLHLERRGDEQDTS